MTEPDVLQRQIEYYMQRAPEYDQWFLREGRYDHGTESNRQWWSEVATVEAALFALGPLGRVLELAAGTGIWTEKLIRQSDSLLAVDSSDETLTLNQARNQSGEVQYVQADIFDWTPPRRFDSIFFGFWLSHVPQQQFQRFWTLVDGALERDGRVFFVDSLLADQSGATDHAQPDRAAGRARRKLNSGLEFEIVKVFYEPDKLERQLAALGWESTIRATSAFFLYGDVRRAQIPL